MTEESRVILLAFTIPVVTTVVMGAVSIWRRIHGN
jgi:hypothetical protein